jgi:peptidoglycan/LPS O-acetylase OafA/YrhL
LTLPGRVSHGGYLYHAVILYGLWFPLAGKSEWIFSFFFILSTFAVAWLSNRYFEVPANFWARKLIDPPWKGR